MAVANTVEATLTSKYVDGVSKGIEQTQKVMQQQLSMMKAAGQSAAVATGAAFDQMVSGAQRLKDHFTRLSNESESRFKRIGFAAAAMSVAVAGAVLQIGASIISWLSDLGKEASEMTELKITFEGLSQAAGWQADTFSRLKRETEGLIGSIDLLRNANRVMQSGVKVSDSMYVELTGNIFKLAKSAGVDGAQAINMMTDSLIKGNTRSLQTIGLHLNMKDAITEAAAAAGVNAGQMRSSAQMQAFYAEILEKTRAAVAKLPPDFVSLDDAIAKAEKSWRGMFLSIGEGINRSAALQGLLVRVSEALSRIGATKDEIDATAIATNRFVISTLSGMASVADIFAVVWPIVNFFWAGLRDAALLTHSVLAMVVAGIAGLVQGVLMVLDELTLRKIPALGKAVEWLRQTVRSASKVANDDLKGIQGIGEGFFSASQNASEFAGWARKTASELRNLQTQSIRGRSGITGIGSEVDIVRKHVEELNKQLKTLNQLRDELSKGREPADVAAINQWRETLAKVKALTLVSENEKSHLRILAGKRAAAELLKIEQEKNNKTYDMARELADLMASVQSAAPDPLKATPPPFTQPPPNLGDDPAYRATREAEIRRREEMRRIEETLRSQNDRATPEWAKPLRDLHLELERLNRLKMDPFHQMLAGMRAGVVDFAAGAGQAIAGFFADWASGQEASGKKLLAAFIGLIGQMLVRTGVVLIQAGIAEMALASTLIGKMMGASHAAGARAIATGAIIAAIGGVMQGAASAMAQTNTAGSGGSFQQSVPRPLSSQQVQVIQVGAAGRAQNQGEATVRQQPTRHEVVVRLERGLIAKEVANDIRSNGPLRTVIQGASA